MGYRFERIDKLTLRVFKRRWWRDVAVTTIKRGDWEGALWRFPDDEFVGFMLGRAADRFVRSEWPQRWEPLDPPRLLPPARVVRSKP